MIQKEFFTRDRDSSYVKKWYSVNSASKRDSTINEYFGKVGNNYFCIQEKTNQISLSRVFGKLVLFWRFFLDGRINNISFKLMDQNRFFSGIQVYDVDALSYWNKGKASYRDPPQESNAILTKIAHLSTLDKYKFLLSRMQGDMISYLATSQEIESDTRLKPHQLPLKEILLNNRVKHSLELSVRLSPEFEIINPSTVMIYYSSERKSLDESSSIFET